jgi:hypothetical protein
VTAYRSKPIRITGAALVQIASQESANKQRRFGASGSGHSKEGSRPPEFEYLVIWTGTTPAMVPKFSTLI